jgi:hypothetical protein
MVRKLSPETTIFVLSPDILQEFYFPQKMEKLINKKVGNQITRYNHTSYHVL